MVYNMTYGDSYWSPSIHADVQLVRVLVSCFSFACSQKARYLPHEVTGLLILCNSNFSPVANSITSREPYNFLSE